MLQVPLKKWQRCDISPGPPDPETVSYLFCSEGLKPVMRWRHQRKSSLLANKSTSHS